MIKEKDLDSWEQLLDEINNLIESLGKKSDELLFRGQASSKWDLDTTMERKLGTRISLIDYYKFAYTAKTKLETFVDTTWDIPLPFKYQEWLQKRGTISFDSFPGYNYLAFLRHHGFPSPL